MPTQRFRIHGLRHEDEERIARGIRQLEGVFYAVLNHQEECAEVDFEDDLVTCAEIRAVIAEFGYRSRNAG
jgi:hypothetical protein